MKNLKFEKMVLNKKIKELSDDNNKNLNKIDSISKQIQDLSNANTNLETENNDIKQKIEEIGFKCEEEENKYKTLKEILAEKDKEISELRKAIENIKKQNKDNIFFTGIGAIGKKKDEVVDTDNNIAQELDQIEKKYENMNISGDLSGHNNK